MRPEVKHVTEIGARIVGVTFGLARAAAERNGALAYRAHNLCRSEARIWCTKRPENQVTDRLMDECPTIDYKFTTGDDLILQIEETDVLFLDTFLANGSIIMELKSLADKVRKLFVLQHTPGIDARIGDLLASPANDD